MFISWRRMRQTSKPSRPGSIMIQHDQIGVEFARQVDRRVPIAGGVHLVSLAGQVVASGFLVRWARLQRPEFYQTSDLVSRMDVRIGSSIK